MNGQFVGFNGGVPVQRFRVRTCLDRSAHLGHSFLELLVALLITGILAAVAVSGVGAIQQAIRLRAAKDALLTSLQISRSQAIYRGGRVVLCKSAESVAHLDRPQCRQTHDWSDGWIVFHDRNNNLQPDSGEAVLHHAVAQVHGIRIFGNRHVTDYISFSGAGNALQQSGAAQMGTLTICQAATQPVHGFDIRLRAAGRVRWFATQRSQC